MIANNRDVPAWESQIFAWIGDGLASDSAHDMGHIRRVLATARAIAEGEGKHDALVLTAGAILHDLVSLPKDHPERSHASRLSGKAAAFYLASVDFPPELTPRVQHAIEAHSFSAGIEPLTVEAKALQDADRLDALGAIGVARCFAVSGSLGRALFDPEDPLAERRPLDEATWALDHFQTKLLKLPKTMTTATGRRIGEERAAFLRGFMQQLAAESAAPIVQR